MPVSRVSIPVERAQLARLRMPGIPVEELELSLFGSVHVIGRGRVGSAVASRLDERGVELREDAELVLLCVPDSAIAEVARTIPPGPWVAHVSGATRLAALEPHTRRFG